MGVDSFDYGGGIGGLGFALARLSHAVSSIVAHGQQRD